MLSPARGTQGKHWLNTAKCKQLSQLLLCDRVCAGQVFLWPQVAAGYQAVLGTAKEGLSDVFPLCWGAVAKPRGCAIPIQ